MLEPLLGTRRHKRGIPEYAQGFPVIEKTPFNTSSWFGSSKLLLPEKSDPTFKNGAHSMALSYDGRYLAAPKTDVPETFIYDISQTLTGGAHKIVSTIPDGGALSGSIDLDIIWFQDFQNSTTLRQWRRTVNLPSGMEYELVRTIPLDTKTAVQSQTDTPVISKDGNTVWTGKFIRKYDETGLVDEVNIGNDVLNVLISESGKRFITFRSNTEIVIELWEKSGSDGSWSIKTSTTYPATFTKRVVSDTETTYLIVAGNYDLSRFSININRNMILFKHVDGQITVDTVLLSHSTVSNALEFTYGRILMCFNRSGDLFVSYMRGNPGNSNKETERYFLNPNTNVWTKSTAVAYATGSSDNKYMAIAISSDGAMLCFSLNQNALSGNNVGVQYSMRSLVSGKPTW